MSEEPQESEELEEQEEISPRKAKWWVWLIGPSFALICLSSTIWWVPLALRDGPPFTMLHDKRGNYSFTNGSGKKVDVDDADFYVIDQLRTLRKVEYEADQAREEADKRAKRRHWFVWEGDPPTQLRAKATPSPAPSPSNKNWVLSSGRTIYITGTSGNSFSASPPAPQVSLTGAEGKWLTAEAIDEKRSDFYAHDNVRLRSQFAPLIRDAEDGCGWIIEFAE